MVDYQLYTPRSTMYNLFSMQKLDKEVFDMEKLAETMTTVLRHHPALLTTFHFNDDGEIIQRYTPEILEEVKVEKLTEFEFENIKDTLVQPFKIIGGKLHRCRVFETEKSGYVFFDVHHTLFDGTSLKVFMGNVGKVYMGVEPDPDYYYLMLSNRENAVHQPFYQESKKYFEDRYEGVEWSSYPETDHESRENDLGEIFADLGIEQAQMSAIERQYKISRNEFFITVAALAIGLYNDKPDVMLSWNYNGRDDMEMMTSVGLLFRELPVGVHFTADMTLRDLFADVQEQVQKGIEHSIYPYVDKTGSVATGESAYLLYQQDIRDMDGGGMNVESIDIRQNQAASQTILDMEILDGSDGLVLMIDYAASRYNNESMERFRDLFVRTARKLVSLDTQADVYIDELRCELSEKSTFIDKIITRFRRKR